MPFKLEINVNHFLTSTENYIARNVSNSISDSDTLKLAVALSIAVERATESKKPLWDGTSIFGRSWAVYSISVLAGKDSCFNFPFWIRLKVDGLLRFNLRRNPHVVSYYCF